MNPSEITRVALLMAAQGDPKRAAEIESYLTIEVDWALLVKNKSLFGDGKGIQVEDRFPAGGFVRRQTEPDDNFDDYPDGIYLLFDGQIPKQKLYKPGTVTDWMKEKCTGVGVKLGGKSLVVDLYDMAGPEDDERDYTLTTAKSPASYDKAAYRDTCEDAADDWAGQANTERMREAAILNPKIAAQLKDGQYVPAMGEMLFIHLFRKQINQALREVGGEEIEGWWYWTSTEYSQANAWLLNLSYGTMGYGAKASYRRRVRAVSAFIS